MKCFSIVSLCHPRRMLLLTLSGLFLHWVNPTRAQTLPDAVDQTALAWSTGGSLPWSGQTNVTFDGVDAAQSGTIADSQLSWLETTVTGPATVSYRWKVSSEAAGDFLEFYSNGVLQSGRISGEVGWQQRFLAIASGTRTLRWQYIKNAGVATGSDRGWVDAVDVVRYQLFSNPAPGGLDAPHDNFGGAVAFVGNDHVIIGAVNEDLGATNAGALYLFQTNGSLVQTFANPTPGAEENFGEAVAPLDSSRFFASAPSDNTGATRAGAVYLFHTNGTLLTTFTNPTPAFADEFGISVAAVGNDRVAIGAWGDGLGAFSSGVAYLFDTNSTALTVFTNPTPASGDVFGRSVAAVGTDRVLIGAHLDDTGATDAGAAYLFSTNGVLLTTFTNPTPASSDAFGYVVTAVGADKVLIGASGDKTAGSLAGAAYLFSADGTLLHTITNPAPANTYFFGGSVGALGRDRLIIGTLTGISGRLFVFSTNGVLLQTIEDPNLSPSGGFGSALAGLPGGDRVLVGADEAEEAFLLELAGTTAPPSPLLGITSAGPGLLSIVWTPATPGFVLQDTTTLMPGDWSNSTSGPTNPVTVPITVSNRFFRVFKP